MANGLAFHSGPQGSVGAAPGLVYFCKDRAATTGIGFYILTDYPEQWSSWCGAAQLLLGFSYFYPVLCAYSHPARAFGVLTTWLSFNTPT